MEELVCDVVSTVLSTVLSDVESGKALDVVVGVMLLEITSSIGSVQQEEGKDIFIDCMCCSTWLRAVTHDSMRFVLTSMLFT